MSLRSRRAERLCARLDLGRFVPRPRDKLAFVEQPSRGVPLLLDTGVYIHRLKGKTPAVFDKLVGARVVNHSVVAVQEMLHAIGVLDPADSRTRANVAAIRGLLDAILHTDSLCRAGRPCATPRSSLASCVGCKAMKRTGE